MPTRSHSLSFFLPLFPWVSLSLLGSAFLQVSCILRPGFPKWNKTATNRSGHLFCLISTQRRVYLSQEFQQKSQVWDSLVRLGSCVHTRTYHLAKKMECCDWPGLDLGPTLNWKSAHWKFTKTDEQGVPPKKINGEWTLGTHSRCHWNHAINWPVWGLSY